MAVQVDVPHELAPVEVLPHNPLRCEDGGVRRGVGAEVDAVEVHAKRVGAIVAVGDAVWVEHGDQLEDEALAQPLGARVVLAQQQLEHAWEI